MSASPCREAAKDSAAVRYDMLPTLAAAARCLSSESLLSCPNLQALPTCEQDASHAVCFAAALLSQVCWVAKEHTGVSDVRYQQNAIGSVTSFGGHADTASQQM